MRPLKIKVSFAYATLTFVNEFVKWSRPLNSIGRLKIGHPGWHFSKPVLELSTTESSFVPEGTNGLTKGVEKYTRNTHVLCYEQVNAITSRYGV